MKAINWHELDARERVGLAAAGEQSPLAFMSLWFNVLQGFPMRVNWHHHYFDYAARKVLAGEVRNVIINVPPGGTKTEFWSIHLPIYAMVRHETVRILNTSYSKDLVNENSGRARAIATSAEFQEFYPFDLGNRMVDNWTLERDGKRMHQLVSRASGGQITGVRGGNMVGGYSGHVQADDWDKIDDLFSETKRKKSQTRLVNTLRSRRATSNTPFVLVQQRGHVDDSAAFLVKGGMGFDVDLHITIPGLVDSQYIAGLPNGIRQRCIRDVCHTDSINGRWSYWPEKESAADMVELSKAHPYTFASQVMQDPETLSGDIFREDDFLVYGDTKDGADLETPLEFEYRFVTADTAQKTNNWNDFTVLCEWGVYQNRIYLLKILRRRMDAKALRLAFESFVRSSHNENHRGVLRRVLVEDKSSGTGLIQEVKDRLPASVIPVQRDKDKLQRALDVQSFHAEKRVVLPQGGADNYEFIAEVTGFTADDSHRHDDQTDNMIDALAEVFLRKRRVARARSL